MSRISTKVKHTHGAQRGLLVPKPKPTFQYVWCCAYVAAASPPDLTPSLWYHLGICRARQGAWMQAAAAFEHAVVCLPMHPALVHELAKALQVR